MLRGTAAIFVCANLVGCAATAEPKAEVAAAVDVALPPPPADSDSPDRADATPPPAPLAEPSSEDERARLLNELEALDSAMLGALGSGSGSGPAILGGVVGGGAGGVVVTSPAGGAPAHPRGPSGNVSTGGAGPDISNAAAVIAGMRPAFRRCYNRVLQSDPTVVGKVLMTARVDANGEVIAVHPARHRLPAELVACISARISSAQFAPPTRVLAEVTIAIDFQPAR